MTGEAEVLFEKRGRLGLITLNRPKALNALTLGMVDAMNATLRAWAADPGIESVTVIGAGDRAFCAGGDIRALYDSGRAGTPYALDFWAREYRLNVLVKRYPKPYVALLNGIVMGGGVGVSVHGSHRAACETTTFAMPETGIGLFPDVGGSYFLPRCPGQVGLYLALTGARIKADDLVYAGIATHIVPQARFPEVIESLAGGGHPDQALAGAASAPGEPPMAAVRHKIDRHFEWPSVEGILASLESDDDEWTRATALMIRGKSPTSSKVALRQLQEGRRLSFEECMRLEYRLCHGFIAGHDFFEGVRAAILDKDNRPQWSPAALEDVRDADIDRYFADTPERALAL